MEILILHNFSRRWFLALKDWGLSGVYWKCKIALNEQYCETQNP